jgi:hypothetical protein
MRAIRLKQLLTPLIGVRAYSPGLMAAKRERERELRQLQRRVAAARMGVSWPRHRVRTADYEDLR